MPNLRLTVDTAALADNWRTLARAGGAAACGAAVKADGYGLGGREVAATLVAAGCRDLFVAHWDEAAALGPQPDGVRVAVLHGVLPGEMSTALASAAVPVLNTPAQVAAWRAATDRPCDVMVDTGIGRLGLTPAEAVELCAGLDLDVLHSHLACADVPGDGRNAAQLAAFQAVVAAVRPRRASLANSAGIALGSDYAFDLIRPGIALYGGRGMRAVVSLQARVVQLRDLPAGTTVGYGATWTAPRRTRLAVVALGYADGFPRAFGGMVVAGGVRCPVVGRVSMDLIAADATAAEVAEGDWVEVGFDLGELAAVSRRSEYELLTGLGRRYARVYR